MKVGNKVRFFVDDEVAPYTVQARGERYIICTKPTTDEPDHPEVQELKEPTVFYTIIDLQEGERGPDDRVFCAGYETQEQCEAALKELEAGEIELSRRNSIGLDIQRIMGQTEKE
ncbi:MAG: hypothetical protein KAR06_07995 [Deltaproteobacteria bacterium]|nr:hypothetical protein [Deltaproteobacteria bacterium]